MTPEARELYAIVSGCEAGRVYPDLVSFIRRLVRSGRTRTAVMGIVCDGLRQSGHLTDSLELAVNRFLVFALPNKLELKVDF